MQNVGGIVAAAENGARAGALLTWMLWLLILLVVALCSVIAFRRFARGMRRWLLPSRQGPTEYVDAWKLHKLPPEADNSPPADEPPRANNH